MGFRKMIWHYGDSKNFEETSGKIPFGLQIGNNTIVRAFFTSYKLKVGEKRFNNQLIIDSTNLENRTRDLFNKIIEKKLSDRTPIKGPLILVDTTYSNIPRLVYELLLVAPENTKLASFTIDIEEVNQEDEKYVTEVETVIMSYYGDAK